MNTPFIITLILLTLLPARMGSALQADTPPDPRFGIVEAFVNSKAATEAGAGYSRIILRWDVIQPAGPDDWKPANVPDPFIEAELAAGRQVVAVLIGTPAWAAIRPEDGAMSVPKVEPWTDFVRRMVQQYRGRIAHWIIWNEPDVWEAGHPGQTWAGTVEDYALLLKTAYLAMKGVDPDTQVHLAGMTYFWDWSHGRRRYLDRLLEVLAVDPEARDSAFFFDAVIYHLYFNPSQVAHVIGEARASLRRFGLSKEIWINETNAPPSEDPLEPPWSKARFRVSLEEQAAFVIQEFALAFAAGATRVEFYKLRNTLDHSESIEPYGLLRHDDSRRPVFLAYRQLTNQLRDFRSVRLERAGRVTAVTFERGNLTTTILWADGTGPARATIRAITPEATLVDPIRASKPVRASRGVYVIDLPGATCLNSPCIIGGAPRFLVEPAKANGRKAFASAVPPPRSTPKSPLHVKP